MGNNRNVIGAGETILDILFRHEQPVAAVPGGSTFNSIISVGRAGVPCGFVGYTGNDSVGRQTVDFLKDNGVGTDFFQLRQGEKSAISLAYLADNGDANYLFYNEPPHMAPGWMMPQMERGDVLIFGSYFAICQGMRPLITHLLEQAAQKGAIVYYDLNFRKNHSGELESLRASIEQNYSQSTVVRGSAEDFEVVYGSRDARDIYNKYIRHLCPYLICTAGADSLTVCTPTGFYEFQAPAVQEVVSTVGAGDSFNAGFACALIWEGIMLEDIPNLSADDWQRLTATACRFAAETCCSTENYIAKR